MLVVAHIAQETMNGRTDGAPLRPSPTKTYAQRRRSSSATSRMTDSRPFIGRQLRRTLARARDRRNRPRSRSRRDRRRNQGPLRRSADWSWAASLSACCTSSRARSSRCRRTPHPRLSCVTSKPRTTSRERDSVRAFVAFRPIARCLGFHLRQARVVVGNLV